MAFLRGPFLRGLGFALLAGLIAFCPPAAPAARAADHAPPPSKEYLLKAAYFTKLPPFVDWPDSAYPGARAPFVIGIIGGDPFGSVLDELISGETFASRPIVVRRLQRVEEASGCQMLFVSRSPDVDLAKLLEVIHGRPILTVGETDNFTHSGGMIRFALENGRVRMHVNRDAVGDAGLTISSHLLALMEIDPSRADR